MLSCTRADNRRAWLGDNLMTSRTLLPIVALTIAAVGSTSAQNNWAYFGQDPGATKYSTSRRSIPRMSRTSNGPGPSTRATNRASSKARPWSSTVDGLRAQRLLCHRRGDGETIWKYDAAARHDGACCYWPGDEKSAARIVGSTGNRLVALDAKTGLPVADFGQAALSIWDHRWSHRLRFTRTC